MPLATSPVRSRSVLVACAAAALAATSALAGGGKRQTAEEGLRFLSSTLALQAKGAVPSSDAERLLAKLAPPAEFESGPERAAGADARRKAFLEQAGRIWVTKGWEDGDAGVAEGEIEKSRFQVPLRWSSDQWVVDASQFFAVGPALNAANGSRPARVKLAARNDKTEGYGSSAVSFAHATQDAGQCKNRMDLWYCWNGELHGSGDTRMVEVKPNAIDGVKWIPPTTAWTDSVKPLTGKVYVARCAQPGRKDFYVTFRTPAVNAAECVVEWKLLAVGYGAPASIQSPQPLVSNDGADGCDGLCGRSGSDR